MNEQQLTPAGNVSFGEGTKVEGDVVAGNKITNNVTNNITQEVKQRPQIQRNLLEKMKNAWINGVLDHALDRTQPIPL